MAQRRMQQQSALATLLALVGTDEAGEASSVFGTFLVECDAAAVTVLQSGRVGTALSSCEAGLRIEGVQHEVGEGPSLGALRDLQVYNVAFIPDLRIWPAFRDVAARVGIVSSLSVPVTARGRALGTLSLYSRRRDAFRDRELAASRLASRVAPALTTSRGSPVAAAAGRRGR